jgi:hypothetical protein
MPLTAELPERSRDLADADVLGKAFRCHRSEKPFSIQKAELKFHQRYAIPLPEVHWLERIYGLWGRRRPVPDALSDWRTCCRVVED